MRRAYLGVTVATVALISACGTTTSESHAIGNSGKSDSAVWSDGTTIDSHGPMSGIACPVPQFCVAVDTQGYAYVYEHGSWSSGQQIDTNRYPKGAQVSLTSVSCSTNRYCAAVDGMGYEFSFNGSTWAPGIQIDANGSLATSPTVHYLSSVSCPQDSLCVAVGGPVWFTTGGPGYAFAQSNESWSRGEIVDPRRPLTSISCPSKSHCVAVDGDTSFTESSGTWSPGRNMGGGKAFFSISCPTDRFCAAVNEGPNIGHLMTFDGRSWTQGPATASPNGMSSISCSSSSFCTAVGPFDGGYKFTRSNGTWSATPIAFATSTRDILESVSCPSSGDCVAVGGGNEGSGGGKVFSLR